jgi:MFS family permease
MTRPRSRPRATVAVLAVGVSAFGLLQSMIIPVLSQIQADLHTDQATVTWVLTAYLLSAAVATPLIGRVGDAVGKQRMLAVTLALLAIGSAGAALAPDIGWMIAARVVAGLGGGAVPLSFGIIRDEVPRERSGAAVGLLASLMSGAFGVGIVIAGPIVEGLGFDWLFWLPAIFTGLAAIGVICLVPASPVRMAGRISVLPAVLLSGWLVALLLALNEGNPQGWASPMVLGLFAAAALLLLAWVAAERSAAVPLIDLELMRSRGVWTANVVAFGAGFGTFASLGFLPQLLQTPVASGYGFGATISESGLIILPSSAVSFVMGFLAPRLVHRLTARWVVAAGLLASTVAFVGVALSHDDRWHISAWMALQGLGIGLVVSSLAGVVLASVPAQQTGVSSGMNANIRLIGGSLGSAMMAGIITARTGAGGYPLEAGYRNGFLVLAVAMALAAGVALLIPRVPGHPEDRVADEPDVDVARV